MDRWTRFDWDPEKREELLEWAERHGISRERFDATMRNSMIREVVVLEMEGRIRRQRSHQAVAKKLEPGMKVRLRDGPIVGSTVYTITAITETCYVRLKGRPGLFNPYNLVSEEEYEQMRGKKPPGTESR